MQMTEMEKQHMKIRLHVQMTGMEKQHMKMEEPESNEEAFRKHH